MSMTLDADLGRVTVADDALRVAFRRYYRKPAEKVWAAVTVPERLADWLAKAEIDPRVGGTVRLTWSDANYGIEGKVVAYDPPKRFAWTWPLDGRDTVVSFEVEADGEGCWLTLTHAGLNTVLDSLACGVPLIAVPITYEQPAIASRIRWTGVGEVLPLAKLNAQRLRDTIRQVASNPSYASKAQVIKMSIEQSGGVRGAADLIEKTI